MSSKNVTTTRKTATKVTTKPTTKGGTKSTTKPVTKGAKSPTKPVVKESVPPEETTQAVAPEEAPVTTVVVRTITVKEIANVLLQDKDENLKKSGRWPLVIDNSQTTCSTFMKYRDTNMLEAGIVTHMQEERIRMALLGAIRYGKSFVVVLDEEEGTTIEKVIEYFDKVQPGLFGTIMDKSILDNENYMKLVKTSDEDDYQKAYTYEPFIPMFKLLVITHKEFPEGNLKQMFYNIRIE